MIPFAGSGAVLRTTHGSARIEKEAARLDPALWNAAFAGRCLDARYYEALEASLAGQFDFRYAVLENARTGQSAIQPFFFADQEITAGLPKRLRWLGRLPRVKMAVAGCAAGEGELACAEPWALEALEETLAQCARREGARILLFKDFPARYRPLFAALHRRGYRRVPSMPGATLALDFSSFEEYLQTRVGADARSNLRRDLRTGARGGALTLEVVRDAAPSLGEITPLYLQTHEQSDFQFERLNAAYFAELGRRMPDRTRFFLWRNAEGRLLAFALCLVHGGVLHYLNVGLDYPEALERHLYFIVWRDLVTWALQQGLRSIETGQLNYEVKRRLGFRLAPRDLYARHVSPVAAPFFACALRFLQPARHDPALRQFPNTDEL
ncbi:MAG: GNAT family N-acetyltransferase [Chthoniobacteraceae bacterium]|nr:GNAT family N-acetyltransferase [Chthoniobacteraceae bacterium]